ncbi:MAG TPA: PGPGW domain-containing protein [Candidatus Binatia bacterium]|jgi:uncharacterized membrane protein YbaN (DUF454 family)
MKQQLKRQVWRVARITAGVALLFLGVIGLFLPFLQGILFLIMGLTLLSTESERAKTWLEWLQERSGWRRGARRDRERGLDDA